MKINGIDIATYEAKQLSVDIQTANINIVNDWLRKSLLPIFLSSYTDFLAIKIQLLFKGDSRDEILLNISNLVSNFMGETDLELDGYSRNYKAVLTSKTTNKTISPFTYTLDLEFAGYCYGDKITETANRLVSKIINIPGNQNTPAIVEITPSIDLIDLVITGLADDTITISNLTAGNKVIIDGEAGTILENGANKFTDFDGWEFPRLVPGANIITFSQVNCDINIKYKPRYI